MSNFALFLLLYDLILTDAVLYLARQLRLAINLGKPLGPGGSWLYFDPVLYLVVPIIWVVIFTMTSVYASRRTVRAVDDFQTVTLALAGVAYFFPRVYPSAFCVLFYPQSSDPFHLADSSASRLACLEGRLAPRAAPCPHRRRGQGRAMGGRDGEGVRLDRVGTARVPGRRPGQAAKRVALSLS